MKKKRSSDTSKKNIYYVGFLISVILIFGIITLKYLDISVPLSGFVVVSSGTTISAGTQRVADPAYGVAKGTLDFILSDNGVVISTSIGDNYTLYFTRAAVSNVSLIKVLPVNGFNGNLTNVDGDSEGGRCSAATYQTTKMYYDENDNTIPEGSEQDVYAITTDTNGCFAVKLRSGINDIYG